MNPQTDDPDEYLEDVALATLQQVLTERQAPPRRPMTFAEMEDDSDDRINRTLERVPQKRQANPPKAE